MYRTLRVTYNTRSVWTQKVVGKVRLVGPDYDQTTSDFFGSAQNFLVGSACCHDMANFGVGVWSKAGNDLLFEFRFGCFQRFGVMGGVKETSD